MSVGTLREAIDLSVSYGQAVGDDALGAKEAADAERRLAIDALRAKRDECYRHSDVASDRRFIAPKIGT